MNNFISCVFTPSQIIRLVKTDSDAVDEISHILFDNLFMNIDILNEEETIEIFDLIRLYNLESQFINKLPRYTVVKNNLSLWLNFLRHIIELNNTKIVESFLDKIVFEELPRENIIIYLLEHAKSRIPVSLDTDGILTIKRQEEISENTTQNYLFSYNCILASLFLSAAKY